SVGAQPSDAVAALMRVTGDLQKFKGDPAPAPRMVAEPKRDKAEIFNEALKEIHGESGAPSSAPSTRGSRTKAADKPAEKSADEAADKPAEKSAAKAADKPAHKAAETLSADDATATTES
ncbi:MAG: 30S ribosomal protein S16, partial [Mycobacteriales bacterium]